MHFLGYQLVAWVTGDGLLMHNRPAVRGGMESWTIVKNDLDVTSTASRELFTLVIL
jgi:hypothetical protein